MGEVVEITYGATCKSLTDVAARYRVMAALHPGGVTFTESREQLLAKAKALDAVASLVAKRPAIVVIEVDQPLGRAWAVGLAFMIAAQVMVIGETAARVLWAAF